MGKRWVKPIRTNQKHKRRTDMKADQIIKNAKIYTSDKNQPMASALAVKDGKFVYVSDEAGLSAVRLSHAHSARTLRDAEGVSASGS